MATVDTHDFSDGLCARLKLSSMAQWKRAGPITPRSLDRSELLLWVAMIFFRKEFQEYQSSIVCYKDFPGFFYNMCMSYRRSMVTVSIINPNISTGQNIKKKQSLEKKEKQKKEKESF